MINFTNNKLLIQSPHGVCSIAICFGYEKKTVVYVVKN